MKSFVIFVYLAFFTFFDVNLSIKSLTDYFLYFWIFN